MTIIRSHYSTLSSFAQAEAPVEAEYPYTEILAAYQGALEEMEEDHHDELDDEYDDDVENNNPVWKETKTDDSEFDSRSLLSNHSSPNKNHQQQQQQPQNNFAMPESKAFQVSNKS
jgi:hypothetical protein